MRTLPTLLHNTHRGKRIRGVRAAQTHVAHVRFRDARRQPISYDESRPQRLDNATLAVKRRQTDRVVPTMWRGPPFPAGSHPQSGMTSGWEPAAQTFDLRQPYEHKPSRQAVPRSRRTGCTCSTVVVPCHAVCLWEVHSRFRLFRTTRAQGQAASTVVCAGSLVVDFADFGQGRFAHCV